MWTTRATSSGCFKKAWEDTTAFAAWKTENGRTISDAAWLWSRRVVLNLCRIGVMQRKNL